MPSATVDAIFHYWEDALMAFDSEDGVILPPAHKPKTLMDSVAVRVVFARSHFLGVSCAVCLE